MPVQKNYYDYLVERASKYKNISFEEAVEVDKISGYINQFDIGLYILENSCFNHEYSLPNKLFEFIQARLCLAISPNIEMKNIVDKYQLGLVSEDFTARSMANKIVSLTPDKIMYYKQQSHKFAYELSSDKTEKLILEEVNKLLVE